jgi:hypothetical protein
MNRLTPTAQRLLDDYCQRAHDRVRGTGADAEEVAEDLRRHVEEEVCAANASTVTEADLQKILARLGEPATAPLESPASRPGMIFKSAIFIFGVLLPLGTLVFELITGASAEVLFDPIPTWFHVLAIALVPAVNFWLLRVAMKGECPQPRALGWLNGVTTGVVVYYALIYLSFVPFACIGIIFFGLGLVPLSPYLALICCGVLRGRAQSALGALRLGRFWPAFAIGLGVMLLTQVPAFLTYRGLVLAASDEPANRRSGVALLRQFGSEPLMLRECYGLAQRRDFDIDAAHWLGTGGTRVSADEAREIFFRVTGKPFNVLPPPEVTTRSGSSPLESEFIWDDALGGETVSGRVKGLSLFSSRLDAVAEPDAANVYCEWTMEFKNISSQPREARAQIALPPGGIVSRVTLWINGEEREAAFGGRAQVRAAYQQVAVVQRRDPVLVTTCGPDRVLMQCFPVPTNGGTMKIRLGITAPFAQPTPDGGKFFWPKFLERNFKIPAGFHHAAWLQSPAALTAVDSALMPSRTDSENSLRGDLTDGAAGSVQLACNRKTDAVWTPALASGRVIRQRLVERPVAPPAKIFFVVDGSVGMKISAEQIAGLIEKIPSGIEPVVIVAGDEPAPLRVPDGQPRERQSAGLGARLENFSFAGGRDNVSALELAWDLASAGDRAAIIWLHDAQPVRLSATDGLRQRLEHNPRHLVIRDVQLCPGPNRIAEQLDGLAGFQIVPDSANLDGLAAWLKFSAATNSEFFLLREQVAAGVENQRGPQVSRQIERLWARDEAAMLAHIESPADASQFAAKQQIVTAWSGAVVLETKAQYDQHGLTPAAMKTVPSVPEPSTWVLLTFGAFILIWMQRRRSSANSQKQPAR